MPALPTYRALDPEKVIDTIRVLHQRICELAKTLRQHYRLACEVVYVDDGSTDATLSIANGLKADALDVQVVSLSRNFGKEAALMAGLDHAGRGAVLAQEAAERV